MSKQEVSPDVIRVTTPLPFRPRQVHAYLVRHLDGWVLVDGGVNTGEARAALEEAVRRDVGDWRDIGLHVVTHMHLDHLGLAGYVRAESGGRLAMGRLDAERAMHAATNPAEEAAYRRSLLESSGAPNDLIRTMEDARAGSAELAPLIPADVRWDGTDGDIEGMDGWRWVWTPGHTAGHLSLYRAADGLLIGGDAVLPHITPTIGVNRQRTDPVGDYLETLDRLLRLGVRRVLPGHGAIIDNAAERIRELRGETLAESGRVLSTLGGEPATAWEATMRRHPADLPPSTRMLALRESLAHLNHLALTGDVARVGVRQGVHGFVRTGRRRGP